MKRNKKAETLNRYSGKDRPGKVRSPNGPLGSRWAYPPGIAESGVGLLETFAGLVVFVLLAMVAANAFRGVAANQEETAQVKVLAPAAERAAESSFHTKGGASGGRTTSNNGSDRSKPDRNGMVKDSRGGRG